ncbi:M-phase inducer phosphatase [Geodia barretti]|uniref:M-phase inducer phosphatase n=1 Tax=Geodia barretti TaxID=519541 RepID=A0AA35RLY1_GEOBA|nr:M-phase inducer phosphatase [Geodia barretti]
MQEPTCAETVDSSTTSHSRGHHQRAPSLVPSAGEGLLNGSLALPPPSTSLSSSSVVGDEGRGSLLGSTSTDSLVGGFLHSPMENCANISGSSSSSFLFSSLITPRRKLSMDLDESTQDASDSGYSKGDSVSVSSVESCLDFTSALEGVFSKPHSSSITTRTPLGNITNAAGSKRGRQRYSQKAKRSISFPNEDKSKRVLPLHLDSPSPSPLPYSPLSHHDSATNSSRKNSLQLINSPLERMTLMSPGVSSSSGSAERPQSASRRGPRPFIFPSCHARENSIESDGYSEEVFDGEESSAETGSLPSRLTALMSAPFTSSASDKDAHFCLRKPPVHSTPNVLPARSNTAAPVSGRFTIVRADSCTLPTRRGSLKRASPCPEASDQPRKKKPPLPVLDSKSQDGIPNHCSPLKGVQLLRSQSCSLGATGDHVGMYPLSPGSDNGEMIGDHSKTYTLPLCKKASVADLKCISPKTLAELVRGDGESADLVDEYFILDCRYPYEYEGGHIPGALNIWSRDSLLEQFFSSPKYTSSSRRRIIIFPLRVFQPESPQHVCLSLSLSRSFSCLHLSPILSCFRSRFMRELDRKKNGMAFPKLYYPELYLLDGGYKAFYEQFPEFCEPNCYVKMLDENHKEELRHFKQRSKSWTGGDAATCKRRCSKLRPRRSTIGNGHTHPAPPPPIKS